MNASEWIIGSGILVTAGIPFVLFFRNLRLYQSPPTGMRVLSPVSLLIPARNEEASIEGALNSALASVGVELEIIVLDDQSEDQTAPLVTAVSRRDPRVRLERAPALPAGWCGKQHACHVLAALARFPNLAFIDADVRLAPDGLARGIGFMEEFGAGSGQRNSASADQNTAGKAADPSHSLRAAGISSAGPHAAHRASRRTAPAAASSLSREKLPTKCRGGTQRSDNRFTTALPCRVRIDGRGWRLIYSTPNPSQVAACIARGRRFGADC